jgi:TRAP-type C4-dicarboxylate transport system permease small subunit
MPALFYLALAPTLTAGAHIGIDILHYRMPPAVRRMCQIIIGLLSAALFVYIAILGAARAWGEYASDASVVSEFGWKTWISVAFIPLGSGLVAIRLVLNALAHAIALLGGPDTIGLPPLAGRSVLIGEQE